MTATSSNISKVMNQSGGWLRRMAGKPRGFVLAVVAYRWARAELVRVKSELRTTGVETRVKTPPVLAPKGRRGVDLALSKVKPTCLERALVLQAWLSGAEDVPDVIVGVRAGETAMQAHAWVDGPDSWFDPSYEEIHRLKYRANPQ